MVTAIFIAATITTRPCPIQGGQKGRAYFSANSRDTELGKKMWDVYISCLNNLSALSHQQWRLRQGEGGVHQGTGIRGYEHQGPIERARASLALFLFEECEACIAQFCSEHDNKLALSERVKLARARREYKGKRKALDKNMSKNMFGGEAAGGVMGLEKEKGKEKEGSGEGGEGNGGSTLQDRGKEKTGTEGTAAAAMAAAPAKQRSANGYGESTNMILLTATAAIIVLSQCGSPGAISPCQHHLPYSCYVHETVYSIVSFQLTQTHKLLLSSKLKFLFPLASRLDRAQNVFD